MPARNLMRQHFARCRLGGLLAAAGLAALLLGACELGAVGLATATPAPVASTVPGALPDVPVKPVPQEITFEGCPPEGDGGDPALNLLKNRVDDGDYVSIDFEALETLPWPASIERRDRKNWPAAEAAEVARYEGLPISIEGWLYNTRQQGPESTNCHGADAAHSDWHIWMVKNAGDDRTNSIVAETTPRVRAQHPGWTVQKMNEAENDGTPVRISGWVMLDPEHPDQVGNTRGTIWEIHPVMKIELKLGGQWVLLDDIQ